MTKRCKAAMVLLLVCTAGEVYAQGSDISVPVQDTAVEPAPAAPPTTLFKMPELLKSVHFNALLRSAFQFPDGDAPSALRQQEARIEFLGSIVPDLDFRLRWRLNSSTAPRSPGNEPPALDFAAVTYRFGQKKEWSVSAGKQNAMVGSWEFEANPTFEYKYSEFVDYQTNIFMMGMKLGYKISENHELLLQVYNTLNETFDNLHALTGYQKNGFTASKRPVGLYVTWLGHLFQDKLQTFYSYDFSKYASGEFNHRVAIGNRVKLNKFAAYLDLHAQTWPVDYVNIASPSVNNYRTSIDPTAAPVFAPDIRYQGAVLRADYEFVPRWFLTAKGVIESASQTTDGSPLGNNFRQNTVILGGLEFQPIPSQQMKFFAYYYNNQVKFRNAAAAANPSVSNNMFAIGILYFVNAF